MMKRSCCLWMFVLLWCVCPGLSSAQTPEQALRECVKAADAACPYNLGTAGMMDGVRYDGRNVVFNVNTASGMIKLSALGEDPKLLKRSLMMNVASLRDDASASVLLRLAAECGAGLTYHYYNRQTGDDVVCGLSSDELVFVLEHGVSDEDLFDINLEMTNLHFPQDINGITAQRLVTVGNRVVFTYDLGPGMSLAGLRQNAATVRQNVLQGLANQDTQGVKFTKLCIKLGKELMYRYRQGDDVFSFVLTNAELRSVFP